MIAMRLGKPVVREMCGTNCSEEQAIVTEKRERRHIKLRGMFVLQIHYADIGSLIMLFRTGCLGALIIFMNLMPVNAACNVVGGFCEQRGYWNVFVSFPGGDEWASDYVGNNRKTLELNEKANSIISVLEHCSLKAFVTNSTFVDGFRGDLVVVLSGPYTSLSQAKLDLSKARKCGISGYSKFGVFLEPGGE